jgi:hypothetical protein
VLRKYTVDQNAVLNEQVKGMFQVACTLRLGFSKEVQCLVSLHVLSTRAASLALIQFNGQIKIIMQRPCTGLEKLWVLLLRTFQVPAAATLPLSSAGL